VCGTVGLFVVGVSCWGVGVCVCFVCGCCLLWVWLCGYVCLLRCVCGLCRCGCMVCVSVFAWCVYVCVYVCVHN